AKKDHPLVTPYPGSNIDRHDFREFDAYSLPLGNMAKIGVFSKVQQLEGKITAIRYINPSGRSLLEIYRNYEDAFKKAGFQALFTCADDACGPGYGGNDPYNSGWRPRESQRHLSARLSRAEGDVYVSLHISRSHTYLTVLESKPMEAGRVRVDAAVLADDLSRTGHTAVHGIYFDVDQAVVKQESAPSIQEIAKMLQGAPGLAVYIVGHTDNTGDFQHNLKLSEARAGAVLDLLVSKFGIASARLTAAGVGPLSPVGSNDTEEGRAQNRRVELVKR
ncbi:MAG: OmpA family protein, partial [Acidobacteriota bacterium]